MLSYAFQSLNEDKYDKIQTEKFENAADMFSQILIIGISKQIKQGLIRDYADTTQNTSSVKGKIEIKESINPQNFLKKQLTCTYDEFTVNCYLNQIIKSTMKLLIKADISKNNRKKLKKLLKYFTEVNSIDLKNITWKIRFDRNSQNYRMLIGICYLTVKGLLQTTQNGDVKLMKFLDNQLMSRLYEKFILNYYRKEHSYLKAYSPQIEWQLDDDFDDLLPKMQTDITLEYEDKILIIDAKYYSNSTQSYFDTRTIHSHNLYQIFTYVKNKEVEVDNEVSGMLLYARTREDIQPDHDYSMSGNRISVKTIDLNQDFDSIKQQLDDIVEEYL